MTYRFGRFTANADTRQLLAEGNEIHLSPKSFELLLVLIEQRARAVSKAELQERLWPSTFVGETNLATLIAEIRRVLGDSAHEPAFVRTVHRFGYRFVAATDEADRAPVAPAHPGRKVRMYLTGAEGQFPLESGVAVIGRASDAAIRIDAGGVSRHHARIVIDGESAKLDDLGSKNGTFVDGKPLTGPRVLRDGDEIRVGPVSLTFRVATPTLATETMG